MHFNNTSASEHVLITCVVEKEEGLLDWKKSITCLLLDSLCYKINIYIYRLDDFGN